MLIILEGPDLAGKSTLAARLQTYLSVKYPRDRVTLVHRGPPTSHPLHEYVTPLLDYWPTAREHIICDRWHIGETVYPSVLDRDSEMSHGVFRYVEGFLAARGALLVHVDASDDDLCERYETRGEEHYSLSTVRTIASTFRDKIKKSTLPTVRARIPEEIADSASFREYVVRESQMAFLKTYVGVPHPMTVYVGDVRGCAGVDCAHTPSHDPRFPAFGPFKNTCGEFLMECLPYDFQWGLVNANDVDENHLSYIRHTDVVALGRLASKKLREYRVAHTVVPHPQYVKRFHYRETDEYRRLLSLRDGKDHGEWRS